MTGPPPYWFHKFCPSVLIPSVHNGNDLNSKFHITPSDLLPVICQYNLAYHSFFLCFLDIHPSTEKFLMNSRWSNKGLNASLRFFLLFFFSFFKDRLPTLQTYAKFVANTSVGIILFMQTSLFYACQIGLFLTFIMDSAKKWKQMKCFVIGC